MILAVILRVGGIVNNGICLDNWFHHQCFGLSKDQRGKIDELSYTCKKCRLFGLFVNNFFAFVRGVFWEENLFLHNRNL